MMENEKTTPKIILTGDRPTGKLHIGHYVGSLRRRVELQNSGNYDEIYIMIADTQALTDNFGVPQKVRDNIIEVALDYLAAGIDPSKSTIFVQSQVPELFELTCYYLDLVTLSRLERNPTVKSEIGMRGFGESIPAGFLCYPVSQAADITAFDATVVPVGEDQEPMIEQANEIVAKFNSLYGNTLVPCKIMEPDNNACKRLPGTDGKAKMSKSLGNCIYLSDDAKTVKTKVMSMFTDPTHLKVEDLGHTEGNPVFIYLDAFAKDEHFAKFLPQYPNLDALKAAYQKGGLGDVVVKRFLNDVLNDVLEPMRARRKAYEADIPGVYKILEEGSKKAEAKAAATLLRVRRALGINYFADKKLIEKQSKAFQKQLAQEQALAEYLAKQKK
jgi:tryptophanyl-tRNA synthetase